MIFKNRCYEQVRTASNGMGCEWTHGYFSNDWKARQHTCQEGNRNDHDDPFGVIDHSRDPNNSPDYWCAISGEGKGPEFEQTAQRKNSWHRKRSEGCVNPIEDDEEWLE